MAQISQTPKGTDSDDLPRWGSSTVKSAPARSHRRTASSGARGRRSAEQQERARSHSLARKSYLAMDKKQLAKECKKLKISATGTKGDMVARLMAEQQKQSSPKKRPSKSSKTWKSDAHMKISSPKMKHANTVMITDCGLKDRTSSKKKGKKKKNKAFLGDDIKSKRKMQKQESRRYDQGKIFSVPGMSSLNLLMNQAAANTEARKSGKEPLSTDDDYVDCGSGSENGREMDDKVTTQPKMRHAKSAMVGGGRTKKKKKDNVTKSAKKSSRRESAAMTSSSKGSKKKKTKSKRKDSMPAQPRMRHANTVGFGGGMASKGKGKGKKNNQKPKKKGRGRSASGTWKSDHHHSKSSKLDPRRHMKKIVSRRYDESIGVKVKGMSGLNLLWAEIDAKKAAEKDKEEEVPEDGPELEHANTIGANLRNMKFDMAEFEDDDEEVQEAKDEIVEVAGSSGTSSGSSKGSEEEDEDEYTTDEDYDDEDMPTPKIDAAMNEQLLNLCYTEDEIVKAVAQVANKTEINDVVEQIEKMRAKDSSAEATSAATSPVYRRPKDDPSPSPSPLS